MAASDGRCGSRFNKQRDMEQANAESLPP